MLHQTAIRQCFIFEGKLAKKYYICIPNKEIGNERLEIYALPYESPIYGHS